jgi:hypothetical protein
MDDHDKVHSLGIFFYVLFKWLGLIGLINEERDDILEIEQRDDILEIELDEERWIEVEGYTYCHLLYWSSSVRIDKLETHATIRMGGNKMEKMIFIAKSVLTCLHISRLTMTHKYKYLLVEEMILNYSFFSPWHLEKVDFSCFSSIAWLFIFINVNIYMFYV